MEDLPLAGGAAKLKPLADEARSAARTQFEALRADPAYEAAVSGDVAPDQFVQKFITGNSSSATKGQVAKMRENLGHDDQATQTMGVAALDHLRTQARINPMGDGNFAADAFNKHLDALRPKLGDLLPPKQADQIDTLGKVARYTTAQPKGSFVNNSNTFVGALAHGAGAVLEETLPGGRLLGKGVRMISDKKAVQRALDPASGLERLKETP